MFRKLSRAKFKFVTAGIMGYKQLPKFFDGVAQVQALWEALPRIIESGTDEIKLIFKIYTVSEPLNKKIYNLYEGIGYGNRDLNEDELILTNDFDAGFYAEEIKSGSREIIQAIVTNYSTFLNEQDSKIHIEGNTKRFYQAIQILSEYCGIPSQDIDLVKNYFKGIVESFVICRSNKPQDIIKNLVDTASPNQPFTISYFPSYE